MILKSAQFLLFCVAVTFTIIKAQDTKMTLSQLKEKIINEISPVEGVFGVAFKDLSNPSNNILIKEHEVFHAASTMKTPVMIEIYKQSSEGMFNLTDSVLVKNEFKSIVDGSTFSMDIDRDSGDDFYEFLGQKKTISDLVNNMIIESGNLATNILIDLVGAENVTKSMRHLGANNIQVLRGVEDIKAYDMGLNNTTTAYDLLLIYEALAEGKVISRGKCEEMISILIHQKHNDMIPALLPVSVKVAHKTGSISGVKHDSGIVYLPDGRKYVLIILSKSLKDVESGEKKRGKNIQNNL